MHYSSCKKASIIEVQRSLVGFLVLANKLRPVVLRLNELKCSNESKREQKHKIGQLLGAIGAKATSSQCFGCIQQQKLSTPQN